MNSEALIAGSRAVRVGLLEVHQVILREMPPCHLTDCVRKELQTLIAKLFDQESMLKHEHIWSEKDA